MIVDRNVPADLLAQTHNDAQWRILTEVGNHFELDYVGRKRQVRDQKKMRHRATF
jgi:hypothetical protein